MNKKLAGTLFVYNGNKFDYCYKEAIQCLLEFCDYVIVTAGGDDNTLQDIIRIGNEKIFPIGITKQHWDSQQGREKLNYFTNLAIEEAQYLGFEYQINLQADEIISENSYEYILKAINEGKEGYLSTRINLWSSPYYQLNVEHNRKPCSTEIVRLTKTYCRSVGDAESVAAIFSSEYYDKIKFYHMGFVRLRPQMKIKSIHMQKEVFQFENYDSKIDQSETFNPYLWFSKEDLKPIDEPLPKLIQKWAKERVYDDESN